jgi:hypothetical protein
VILQKPKQEERGNQPTFLEETSCLTPMLEELLDTLVVKMDFHSLMTPRFGFIVL